MEETASGDNCQKLCEKENGDVISGLPDDILCHILSFLPTECAMATSILSTRWRNLWTSVTNLDINDSILYDRKNPSTIEERKMIFVNFMDRLFIHRNNLSIPKFQLSLGERNDFSCVKAWMSHLSGWISSAAIMRDVEELSLFINCPVRLPENLYRCEKLVTLKLYGHIKFDDLQSVCFPSLKVLHLERLRMLDNTSIEVLLSGSPALEELEISMVECDSQQSIHVRSLSLKRLIMQFFSIDNLYNHKYHRKLTIDTPNLEFLKLVDFASEELSMLLAHSLLEADLCFRYQPGTFTVGFEEYADMVVQFYRQISAVKILSLSEYNIRVSFFSVYSYAYVFNGHSHQPNTSSSQTLLEAAQNKLPCVVNLPSFWNLTRLEVQVCDEYVWILPEILKCSSNLEVFVLTLGEDAYGWNWCAPQSVPQCLSSCLQVIEFKKFDGDSGETKMVEYFLRNALVLKKMTITYEIDLKNSEVDVVKRLSKCPKGSNACQIAIIPRHGINYYWTTT